MSYNLSQKKPRTLFQNKSMRVSLVAIIYKWVILAVFQFLAQVCPLVLRRCIVSVRWRVSISSVDHMEPFTVLFLELRSRMRAADLSLIRQD